MSTTPTPTNVVEPAGSELQFHPPREDVHSYGIDATPDDEYPLRILKAHRDACRCEYTGDGPLPRMMNEWNRKRAGILDRAIAALGRPVVEPSGSTELRLRRQPTPKTCVHACLAMVLDVPVDRVIGTFGEASMGHDELMAALRACGIRHVQLVSPRLVIHGWHFAVVPSLNFRGGNHQILIHNNIDDGGLSVLDPTCQDAYAADGSNLKSWTDLVFVRPGGRLPNAQPSGGKDDHE